MGDPAAAIGCYDSVLEDDPENVEALSYRGWAHLRSDDPTAAQADLDRAAELDPTYPDVRVFRAIAATRAGDFEAASAELSAFYASEPEGFAVSIVESEGLERTIFFALLDDGTAACWKRAADEGRGEIDQQFLDALGDCLDDVLAVDPTGRDARLSRAIAEVGPGGGDPALVSTLLAGLLAEDPDDADALGLQVLVQLGAGELDAAEQSLDRLAGLPRAPSAFLVGDVDTLRAALDAARDPEGGPRDADGPGGS
jgi:predicted Zn-dependent protease